MCFVEENILDCVTKETHLFDIEKCEPMFDTINNKVGNLLASLFLKRNSLIKQRTHSIFWTSNSLKLLINYFSVFDQIELLDRQTQAKQYRGQVTASRFEYCLL